MHTIRNKHAALSFLLQSVFLKVARGSADQSKRFFDVMRAMLFYIDEVPDRLHYPKASDLLFSRRVRAAVERMPVIERLEADHMRGEGRVADFQHPLLAWELIGDARRPESAAAAKNHVAFYCEHIRVKETQLLPVAKRVITDNDWAVFHAAFPAQLRAAGWRQLCPLL